MIWAGFGPIGNTEKKVWADYEQLLRTLFFMFSGANFFYLFFFDSSRENTDA